jgi:hypothetical protein
MSRDGLSTRKDLLMNERADFTDPPPVLLARGDESLPVRQAPDVRKSPGSSGMSPGTKILLIVLLCLLPLALVGGGVLVAVGVIAQSRLDQSKEGAAKVQAKVIATETELYYLNHDTYPDSVEVLTQPDPENKGRPYLSADQILDPWGKPYKITPPSSPDDRVRVWTVTPDGKRISNR